MQSGPVMMVHYIRFLKTPRVANSTSSPGLLCVTVLITITTDLGDTFLLSDASLTSNLVTGDNPTNILCETKVTWYGGSRHMSLAVTTARGEETTFLRLHVFPAAAGGAIPSILDAWSASFHPVANSYAAPLVERQFLPPSLPALRIWEETGDSIARHVWDAALGCLLCIWDTLSANVLMPGLTELFCGPSPGRINVIELGSGCGVVGINLAQCYPNCTVQLTDLADAQNLLSENLKQADPAKNSSLLARILDWDVEPPMETLEQDVALVIVSDCTYNADSCAALVKTLARLASFSPSVRMLIAMKRRHDSEVVFFHLMRESSMQILEQTTINLPSEALFHDDKLSLIEVYLYGLVGPGDGTRHDLLGANTRD